MKLADMTPRNVHKWQQFALTRLQLRFTAETQKLYADFADWLSGVVLQSADAEGYADGINLYGKLPAINTKWHRVQVDFVQLFQRARIEAASIPFGALVVQHNARMKAFDKPTEKAESLTTRDVDTLLRLWRERRSRALEAAAQRVYSDGLVLSQRIWQLENGGFDEIRGVINHAFIERTSAVKLSKDAAHLLGAGQNCPRWAYSRLYGMNATERLEDTAGLLKGDECNSTGLSYKALRMARNEIQHAHHSMNDDILRHSPWVVGEKIFLSEFHPEPDICDEYASGGPYEAGSVILPLHIQCMCGKLSVNMQTDDFINQVRGWMVGENDFLDDYSNWLGVADPASIIDWGLPLASALEIWTEQTRAAHSVALGVR
jgi:hypothetical protein